MNANARVVLVGILALAACLRFAFLGQHDVWFDEAFVVWMVRFPWQEIPKLLSALDSHPPLYYLFMKAWIGLAGTGEAAIRLPAAGFSVLSVGLTYVLMRRVSAGGPSLLSAFLLSVSPLAIMAGQDARMYALLGTLALGSTLALVISAREGGRLRWAAYAALAALMAYTQYLGCLVLVAHGIWTACYERRHFRNWIACMAVVAVAYAPWVPWLWKQVLERSTQLWVPQPNRLGDLLGLFAFGGSLFGMGGYFGRGSLGPIEQLIVLLPFLVILWMGVKYLAADPARAALLGLPPAMTIGVMFTLSLWRPVFYPRWFSFLVPFYTVFVACGLLETANSLRGRPDRTAALLTAGLILYSLPVLSHYYLDPDFRPYRWHDAALAVQEQAHPGDLFLYSNDEAKIAFAYYFHDPHPSLTLDPNDQMPGNEPAVRWTIARAQDLAKRYPRVWLIATPPFDAGMQSRLQALHSAFRFAWRGNFGGTWVNLLEAGPSPPGGR